MKKIRMKTWQLALALLLSVLLPVCLVASLTRAQTVSLVKGKPDNSLPVLAATCRGGHTDEWEFFVGKGLGKEDGIGMLPPVTVLDIQRNRINWVFAGHGIHLGSLDLEPGYSIVPKDFDAKNHSGCYGISYCRKHLIAVKVVMLPQEQCRTVKQ